MTPEARQEINALFHERIPITRAMGVRVEFYDGSQLVLTAPLEINHNHLGTAFGGSLGAVATLAGYGLIWLELGDRDAHVVIRDSRIRYRRPVRREIRAVCRRPAGAADFRVEFARQGKARLSVPVVIEEDGEAAVEFDGTYVALR